MDVRFDDKGDIDRESFLVEVKNGRQEVIATLPPLNGPIVTGDAPASKPAAKPAEKAPAKK
jgi:branched-chain amino acid transport system substrate-binding protein